MARPLYTPPPAGGPPTVGDPDFASKADAYLGWFPTHGTFSDNLATWFQTEFFGDLADGTAALPAVRFKNDANTGLYRAGPDQLAFSEGGVDRGRIYGRKNIVGSVGQSGGTPTGAVIERGSNANGEFTRFADGTQICTVSPISSSAAGGSTWTYPAAFVYPASPGRLAVSGTSATTADNAWYFIQGGIANGTSLSFDAVNKAGARVAAQCTITAIGRWY
jgi:hypothetical protein